MSPEETRQSQGPTEPGWHFDPDGRYSHQAYWDGEKWTGDTRPPPRQADGVRDWLWLGLAVALALVVFVIMMLGAGIAMLPGV